MIKITNDVVDMTLVYLEEHYGREEQVYIHILEGFGSLTGPDGK